MFITIEGIDGSGKTTQVRMLRDFLFQYVPVIVAREPGSTMVGSLMREILLNEKYDLSERERTLLFNVSRAALVNSIIKPALRKGVWVICDRYTTSTLVYQGEDSEPVNQYATLGIEPHLEILLDIDPALARKRKMDTDEFNSLDDGVDDSLRKRYLEMVQRRRRYIIVDASLSRKEVFEYIEGYLLPIIENTKGV